jgi:hypothetical protein
MVINHVIKSSDVIWSNKTYGEWNKSKDHPKMTEDDLSDTEVELNVPNLTCFDAHVEFEGKGC